MTKQTLISFPNMYAAMGAASYLKVGVRFCWIGIQGREVKVSRKAITDKAMGDAFECALIAQSQQVAA